MEGSHGVPWKWWISTTSTQLPMEFLRNKLLSTLFVAFSYSSPWLVYVHHCHFSLSPLSPLGATLRWCSCAGDGFNPLVLNCHRGNWLSREIFWMRQPRFCVDILTLGTPPVLGRTMTVDHTIGDFSDPFLELCSKAHGEAREKASSWAKYNKMMTACHDNLKVT